MTLSLPNHSLRVETNRFGPFTFQIGCEASQLETLFLRVNDAQQRFSGLPFAQVAHLLEKEVVVSSIFGTNTIEGGTLSEEETAQALELNPAEVQETKQRRVLNIKAAYDLSRLTAKIDNWRLDTNYFTEIHATLTDKIPDEYNKPGLLRSNPKELVTYVGNSQHGGQYKPPQNGQDIKALLDALAQFNSELTSQEIPTLIRAPLVHYYYELIHPFWDGNGRVGRIVEATILQADGFQYAPFAQAGFYLKNIDKYFTLFNVCRKASNKKHAFPNTQFVYFFLEGMFESLNKLHDRVNDLVKFLVFENQVKRFWDEKKINARQYAIVSEILKSGKFIEFNELRRSAWYVALYLNLTDKTSRRDLTKLKDLNLIFQDDQNRLWPFI